MESGIDYKKKLSLAVLTLQTSSVAILLRYTRTQAVAYEASTAVLFSEVLKFAVCVMAAVATWKGPLVASAAYSAASRHSHSQNDDKDKESQPEPSCSSSLLWEIVNTEAWRMLIPAALYAVQNNILFIAITNLDSVSYQVLYQSKIATTAFFAWIMLDKRISRIQIVALLCLICGVVLVQLGPSAGSETHKQDAAVVRGNRYTKRVFTIL